MKFSTTHFLEPFLVEVRDLVPLTDVAKVYQLATYRQQGRRLTAGRTWKDESGGYAIGLTLRYSQRKQVDLYDVLETLAHELAHVVHWSHGPAHWNLTYAIGQRFTRVLKRFGIEDLYVECPRMNAK